MSDQSRRRQQPKVAVKEKRESNGSAKKPGLFGDFFGGMKNPLVPASQPVKPREATIRTQDTLTPRPPPSASDPIQNKSKSAPRPGRKETPQKEKSNPLILFGLAILAAMILSYSLLQMKTEISGAQSDEAVSSNGLPANAVQERIDYYRKSVGHRLNRERVGVEYENHTTAPRLNGHAKKVSEPDMMNGLPLATESHHRVSSRDRAEAANPDYPDEHIAYSLREQQQLNEADRRAQKQYLDEFVANAAKAGYKVKIDKNGNVNVVGRLPAAGAPAGPSASGSMQ